MGGLWKSYNLLENMINSLNYGKIKAMDWGLGNDGRAGIGKTIPNRTRFYAEVLPTDAKNFTEGLKVYKKAMRFSGDIKKYAKNLKAGVAKDLDSVVSGI